MTSLVLLAVAGCLAVDPASDRILARDVVPAWPALASVPADAELGIAPAPGVVRTFGTAELLRLAARFSIPAVPPATICLERRVAPLVPAAMLAAMQRELPGATIEIVDYGRAPVPQGIAEFPRTGLHPAPGGGLWNGAVRYGGNRRFLIWARVKLGSASRRVIALQALKVGESPSPQVMAEVTTDDFPDAAFTASIEEIAGKVLRRSVATGEAIRRDWLERPKLVLRGEPVWVEVQRGAAHLKLEAIAEASGAAGDTIPVLNPVSHRTFRARVEERGLVTVAEGKS